MLSSISMTPTGWKVFIRFFTVCVLAGCSQSAGAAAVPGQSDPNALDYWELRTNIFLKALTYGQGKLVGVTSEGIYNSADGRKWRKVEGGTFHFDVIYAADTFVVVGEFGFIASSTNGVIWRGTNVIYRFYGIAHGDGKFVAVGDGGPISVSETLGTTWTNVIPATNSTLWAVAYGVGQFVAVGEGGRTMRSTNAYDWIEGNVGTNAAFYDVLYAEGLFVAVSYEGVIYASEDGVVWTHQASFPTALYNVVHHNGIFVSAGVRTVVSSEDGRTWVSRIAPPVAITQNIFTAAAGANTLLISASGPSGAFSGAAWQSSPLTYTEPQVRVPTQVAAHVASTRRLEAVATGTLPLSYQWEKDGTVMDGMTNATLTISNVNASHAGNYRVWVSNVVGGVFSDTVDVKVGIGPGLVTPVPNVTTVEGGTVVMSVSSAGTPPLTFIWRRPNLFLTSAVQVLNVSNSFFRLSPVQMSDAGMYGVTVTNLFGTNVSGGGAARLTVEPDNDTDGLGDIWESLYGLNTNEAADASLDLDGDLHSSLQEFIAGTDPTNAASVLRISEIAASANNAAYLRFTAMSNLTYSIEMKTDASAGTWARLSVVPAARTNRTLSVFDSGGPSSRIYRLVTPAQP